MRTPFSVVVAGLIACLGAADARSEKGALSEWRHYLGGQDSASYSALDQILDRTSTSWRWPVGLCRREQPARFNPTLSAQTCSVRPRHRRSTRPPEARNTITIRCFAGRRQTAVSLLGEQGSISADSSSAAGAYFQAVDARPASW